MNGWSNGWTRWTNRWTNGWTNEWTKGWRNGWTNGWKNGLRQSWMVSDGFGRSLTVSDSLRRSPTLSDGLWQSPTVSNGPDGLQQFLKFSDRNSRLDKNWWNYSCLRSGVRWLSLGLAIVLVSRTIPGHEQKSQSFAGLVWIVPWIPRWYLDGKTFSQTTHLNGLSDPDMQTCSSRFTTS